MSDGGERRGYRPADPRRDVMLTEAGLPNLSAYRKEDLTLIHSAIKRNLLSPETMLRLQETLAMLVGDPTVNARTQISAFKVLAPMWLRLLEMLANMHASEAKADVPAVQVNQQFNLNIPSNGRVPNADGN